MRLSQHQPRFSRDACFVWEAARLTKHEYVVGEVFATLGVAQDYLVASGASFACVREHLWSTQCRAYTSEIRREVLDADSLLCPDAMVSCEEAGLQRPLALQAPCLMVQVASDSNAAFDRVGKSAAFRQLASLLDYQLVDIARHRVELFRRHAEGWMLHEPAGAPPVLALASIGLQFTEHDVFGDLGTISMPAV